MVKSPTLTGVSETPLIPLCIRALESERPDALIQDARAVELVARMHVDPARVLAAVDDVTRVATVLRTREFDRQARDFISRCPDAVVVHIGCGLDARFERVDNGHVEWYDLDLARVIEWRRQIIGDEGTRQHFLACSVLDRAWLDAVSAHSPRPFLFLAEGVLMYLEEAEVRALVSTIAEQFPGAELVLDAFSPFFVWANNLRVARTQVGAPCRWALKRGQDVERWGADINLLDEWFTFASGEPRLLASPRLARAAWVLRIPLFARAWGIYRYWIGESDQ